MPIVPIAPPQSVPVFSGFDYVTVDAQRRRVYAAHTGSRSLLIVDADAGTVIGQVRVGPMHGVAVDPASGHVFTGNGDDNSISEVDPTTMKVVRSVDVPGAVDAIAYDAALGRIYGDEDDGTRLFVIDAKTFKPLATVALPGHKPEYLAVDPQTHEVYQNIADLSEMVVVDPQTLKVSRTIKTPELTSNHPLQYDATYGEIITAGANGVMSVYDRAGVKRFTIMGPKGIDQCDLDQTTHVLGCAHGGNVTLIQISKDSAPAVMATLQIARGIHTLAIDPKTHNIWAVWGSPDGSGDFVQRFSYSASAAVSKP